MSSRFKDKLDSHVLSTALHKTKIVDDTTLSIGSPTDVRLSDDLDEEADAHLEREDMHVTASMQGTSLVLSASLTDDIVSHLSDTTAHMSVAVSDGVLTFSAPNMSGNELVDLEKYVPAFIADMDEMHQVLVSQGREVAREWLDVESLEKQMFVDNADWSLDLWETNYGIATDEDLDNASRRNAIIARLTIPATTTKDLVKETAETLTGNTVWVEEEVGHVNIWLMDRDIPKKNLDQFIEWFETYKPAHLGYTLDYFTMRWKDCLPYVWNDLMKYTWRGVLLGFKDAVTTWQNVEDTVGTWASLNDNHTWYTANKIKESTADEN